jgi:elongator complex protein 1
LACANLASFEQPRLASLARAIADSLGELKDFHSAATVHHEYLNDVESAGRVFCRGHFYADAIRILSLDRRTDLLGSVVDAGLLEGMGTTTELLAECRSQLNAQVPRLRELRVKKVEEPLAFFSGDGDGGADIPDDISLAATNVSTTGGTCFTR